MIVFRLICFAPMDSLALFPHMHTFMKNGLYIRIWICPEQFFIGKEPNAHWD